MSSPAPSSSYVAYSGSSDFGPSSNRGFAPLPSFDEPLDAPFSDPPTADLPAMPVKKSTEQTQELELGLAGLDIEQTVDIDHLGPSFLPPFLGNKNKA